MSETKNIEVCTNGNGAKAKINKLKRNLAFDLWEWMKAYQPARELQGFECKALARLASQALGAVVTHDTARRTRLHLYPIAMKALSDGKSANHKAKKEARAARREARLLRGKAKKGKAPSRSILPDLIESHTPRSPEYDIASLRESIQVTQARLAELEQLVRDMVNVLPKKEAKALGTKPLI